MIDDTVQPADPTTGVEILVVNEDGFEVAIERQTNGKWIFAPTTFDGQRPRINYAPAARAVEALRNIRDVAYFDSTENGALYYRKAENELAAIECRDAIPKPTSDHPNPPTKGS
jgi:hypothetical protein